MCRQLVWLWATGESHATAATTQAVTVVLFVLSSVVAPLGIVGELAFGPMG